MNEPRNTMSQKNDAPLTWMKWSLGHALHWAVLYGAFALDLDGAMYLLKFTVWVVAPMSLVYLTDELAKVMAKRPPNPVRHTLTCVQSWTTLGLLVWHGHIATALAWGLAMLCAAYCRDQANKFVGTAPAA